jgi:Domain of unknown function (DUF4251)
MPKFKLSRLLLPLLVIFCFQSIAQSDADKKKQNDYLQLKSLIEAKKFRFHALSATSMKGMTRQLTSEYFLKLNNDSLWVDLPYYGRSFTTSYPPTDLSTSFTSNQFGYSADSAKKGGWEITVLPKNEPNASKINISITSSGYGTVRISSNSRQPISYYGTITAYDSQ